GGDKTINKSTQKTPSGVLIVAETQGECEECPECEHCAQSMPEPQPIPQIGDELVSREEFINMMMAMRSELAAINARLDKLQNASGEKTFIKVQQIPLEPKQHVMEEVFEIRFDFDKSNIKPEYQDLIRQLASATQENKNIKVSVVGHTDTAGSSDYNYALGGRRAEAVQKMLIEYGIPASQIVAVSAGEEDLAVPTPNNTPNAANRRVRVVKEIHYTEEPKAVPMEISVEEVTVGECGEYGCEQ
ncbi:MAG: OmpA family protein, partial [Alphaproteobacteria bacterium]|nr:OmpA family protein [Alphaproteobacteria bacterium]